MVQPRASAAGVGREGHVVDGRAHRLLGWRSRATDPGDRRSWVSRSHRRRSRNPTSRKADASHQAAMGLGQTTKAIKAVIVYLKGDCGLRRTSKDLLAMRYTSSLVLLGTTYAGYSARPHFFVDRFIDFSPNSLRHRLAKSAYRGS